MDVRYAIHPEDFKKYDTEKIRKEFLIQNLMTAGKIQITYSHYDRFIVAGAVPVGKLVLPSYPELRAEYFLERREMGVINTGETGFISVDGQKYELKNKECLYIGKGKKEVIFESKDPKNPAKFYICSCPAHKEIETQHYTQEQAEPMTVGTMEDCNNRTIYKYIHLKGIKSCQLVMGLTMFKPGSIWNTMPSHVHDRRMEAYFYFDMGENVRVMHFMGQPQETRHMVVKNDEAILSPTWSLHSGVGTSAYSFIWAMAGENLDYTDMDIIPMDQLR